MFWKMIYLSKIISTELDGNTIISKDVWAIKTDFGTIEVSCEVGHFDETELYIPLSEIKEQFGNYRWGQKHDLYRPYTFKNVTEEEFKNMEQERKDYLIERIASQIRTLQSRHKDLE